ncbi:MAG: Lrp/AsnC family transcriptional regulator [Candidatus Auribacter fodinae]|uniref:siroheme decarboxylase n=1 Tax=Candidatus Auribacter fodinae TaxID=2093366 RepID=A0A3A4RFU3_9BACT|nr:MAG: Lrp/AsnC family transcriptional regulator [Candidatus Auribacter fodinae]
MLNDMVNAQQEELMFRLQKGIPIAPEPFDIIGEEIGLPGTTVVELLFSYFKQGIARRFGGIFDVRRLGYTSVLCAAVIPEYAVDEVAQKIIQFQGITHCYLRTSADDLSSAPPIREDGLVMPNLWFTLSSLGESFDDELQSVRDFVAPYTFLTLPALRRFKINVILDPRQRKHIEPVPSLAVTGQGHPAWDGVVRSFSLQEKKLIRFLQQLPVSARPFEPLASATGYDPEELCALLKNWEREGILKRVGLILNHRNAGFRANGMCIWRVPDETVEEVGRTLAVHPEITHCYERSIPEGFPYNLFAMIHTDTVETARGLFGEISDYAGLSESEGLVFISTKEYKKTSLELFPEPGEDGIQKLKNSGFKKDD